MCRAHVVARFVDYLRSCFDSPHVLPVTPGTLDTHRLARAPAVTAVDLTPQMEELLLGAHFQRAFSGHGLDIFDRGAGQRPAPAPDSFRVAAIVPAYNEADVLRGTLDYLTREGIGVYVIDNWSADATPRIAAEFEGHGLLACERFPYGGPPTAYDLRGILTQVELVANRLDADWVVLHDADERRRSPWPGVSLRDALFAVDRAGFNCIDHVTLNFWPVDNTYDPACDLEAQFPYFEFSAHPGHFHQRRAWKNLGRVALAPTAGHDVAFGNRRVYPYKFLLKHYPLRSQVHAERKVLHERRQRWNQEERALGWHQQYDETRAFVRQPGELERFDPNTFYARRLIERLSGVGIFAEPPFWATPPTWQVP